MKSIYSVGQVNSYIKNMFSQDFMLNRIDIKGEVSNCKYHNSGHIYFSLKDETGAIACVMFAGSRRGLAFSMKNGDKVVVCGSVNVYERDGKYQLYAKEITLEGAGLLYERFLALKKELEEMGMFSSSYKQPIPRYIKKLGVVTAPTGAAIQDIMNIARRRNPYIQMILYPALVQGQGAKESIVKGIAMLDALGVDVIIVGRGGGSIEDLWAFNEEEVARAIFHCKTPVISAVGHETDTTIADFVADLRAPTPSAAAELAVEDYKKMMETFFEYHRRICRAINNRVEIERQRLNHYRTKLTYLSPENQVREKRQQLIELEEKVQDAMQQRILCSRQKLQLYMERFRGLSPLNKLNQGFSYVEDKNKAAVTRISQVKKGDTVLIQVSDGCIQAVVESKRAVKRGKMADGR